MRKNKRGKNKKHNSPKNASLIKDIDFNNIEAIDLILKDDYPIFCFKYLSDVSIKDCTDHSFFISYLKRLQKLSELGWDEIRKSDRHSYGMESIPVNQIKHGLPVCITNDVKKLHVFRASGNNLPFVGLQVGKVFRVFFIETNFGDIYDHD